MEFYSIIGIIAVAYVGYRFVNALGQRFPIPEMIALIAGMQWIIGAYIEYLSSFEHYKYHMYVDENTYMSYVVPAYLLFIFSLFFVLRKTNTLSTNIDNLNKYSNIGIFLFIFGFIADYATDLVPESLRFVIYLLANLKYVGVLILYFSDLSWHRYLFYVLLLYLFYISLQSGFFHEFILWSAFFYMFWAYKNKTSVRFNIIIIVTGFIFSTAIQAVKADYRSFLNEGGNTNYASLFIDILNRRISGGLIEDEDQQGELNVRLNQGWIISAIMEHTPEIQEFGSGETIMDALYASVLPRFLNPNKKKAGGRENFEKYTGIPLASQTSMGMSLVGEGYANYGRLGGIVFMGFWGLFIGLIWVWLQKIIVNNKLVLFFLPLLFLQVVKAETELVVVLNHLVKSGVLVFLIVYALRGYINLAEMNRNEG